MMAARDEQLDQNELFGRVVVDLRLIKLVDLADAGDRFRCFWQELEVVQKGRRGVELE